MKLRLFLFASAALVTTLCSSSAQNQIVINGMTIDMNDPKAAMMMQQAEEAAAQQQAQDSGNAQTSGGAKKTPEAERKEQFLKLSFDRRPSTVLKVWSTLEKTEADYKKEDEEEQTKLDEAEAKKAAEAEEAKKKAEAKKAAENPVPPDDAPAEEKPPLSEEEQKAADEAKAKAEEAQVKAEEQKKETAKKAKEKAAAVKAQTKSIARELEKFQRAVTLSDWDAVTKYFTEKFEKEDDQKAAYTSFISKVGTTPNTPPKPAKPGVVVRSARGNPAYTEKNVFLPADIIGIADASPVELEEEYTQTLGRLLATVKQQGSFIEEFVAALEEGTARLGGDDAKKKFAAARLLIAANSAAEAGAFLPDSEDAASTKNVEALQLLGQYYLALREKEEKQKENLVYAWKVNQKILDIEDLKPEDKEAALIMAVDLAPKVAEELGDKWMVDSFTSNLQRGMEVISTIGSAAAESRGSINAETRLKTLELQSTAVESLLTNAGARADEWKESLGILAMNWLHEAEFSRKYDTSDSMQSQMQWDEYGNMFWGRNSYQNRLNNGNNNMPQAIKTGDLLEIAPSAPWMEKISAALQPKFTMVLAQLYLKVKEDERAYPFIESLAKTQPKTAHDLANEFIRVWTTNHDPNNQKRRTSSYMYFYGFSQRADTIPLTRSKQVRNLEELAKWVKKLHELPIEPLDEDVVTQAFVTTHSQAEVYRIEDIQQVFGSMESLKPETMAQLLQTMRANLASVWRDPKVQQDQKTKRKDKDIQAEIIRGYEVANSVVESGVQAHPKSWHLQLAKAAILFDATNYEKTQQASSDFTEKKAAAFAEFEKAATLYADALPTIDEIKETADIYLTWFYASLGASDLEALKGEQVPNPAEQEKIQKAITALPKAVADRHIAKFGNSLASRISSVQAELKQRYLKGGLAIAGDIKETRTAASLYNYYADLISEIQLVATIDGNDRVGDGQPFGMFVDLFHTTHIERESGGFAKYLTNQNNSPYAWNYGRPTENYRDKFEEAARESLNEHFDVMSVTFHSEKIKSRGTDKDGWRVTPYAYILMKTKGAQVDSIPSLRMDMDFLDTSGFVVLPIESAKLPIDATKQEARPASDLAITQTLDESKAKDGILSLEIKTTGHGVIPDIDTFLDVKTSDFVVSNTEDKGVAVMQLDGETENNAVISERNWLIEYKADGDTPAATFKFPTPKGEAKEVNYQRYDDADMIDATETISLVQEVGKKKLPWWVWPAVGAAVFLLVIGIMIAIRLNKQPVKRSITYRMPKQVTPFTVISLLQRIRDNEKLSRKRRSEIDSSIENLESHYFATEAGGPVEATAEGEVAAKKPSLKGIARTWIERVTA
jgi:hypothetical protein